MNAAETIAVRAPDVAEAVAPLVPAFKAASWRRRADLVEMWFEAHDDRLVYAEALQRARCGVRLRSLLQALLEAADATEFDSLDGAMLNAAGINTSGRQAAAAWLSRLGIDVLEAWLNGHPGINSVLEDTTGRSLIALEQATE